jgi:hypothetical protein
LTLGLSENPVPQPVQSRIFCELMPAGHQPCETRLVSFVGNLLYVYD